MDYLVVDRPMGAPIVELEAALDSAGADGWWLIDTYPIQYEQRRSIFKKMPGVVEYLVTEAATGRTAAEAETVLDSHGAEGWELINLYLIMKDRRRAIYARTSVTEKQSAIYRFNTSTAWPVPSGDILIDNADPALATYVYASNLNAEGTDVSRFLATLKVNDKIYIQDQNDANHYYLFHLIGPPEPNIDYVKFPVAFDERLGADLANNSMVVVVMGTDVGGGNGGTGAGGNVSNSGTPTIGQFAQWTDPTHIKGVDASALPPGPPGPQGEPGESGQAAGRIFYYATSDASDIAGYKTMLSAPSKAAEQTVVSSCGVVGTDVLVGSFATDPGSPGADSWPPGSAYRRFYAAVDRGSARFRFQYLLRDEAGVETLYLDELGPVFSNTTVELIEWIAAVSGGPLKPTDRIVHKLYAQRVSSSGGGIIVTTYFEGAVHASQVQTTISAGAQGPPGKGVPIGGAIGQILAKNSATDFDTSWQEYSLDGGSF